MLTQRVRVEPTRVVRTRLRSDRTWLPELENRGLAYLLLGLSFVGGATELATTAFAPRLVLYAVVLSVAAFGLVRQNRRARRPQV